MNTETVTVIIGNNGKNFNEFAIQLIDKDNSGIGVWTAKNVSGLLWLLENTKMVKDKNIELFYVTKNNHSFFHRGITSDFENAKLHYGLESITA